MSNVNPSLSSLNASIQKIDKKPGIKDGLQGTQEKGKTFSEFLSEKTEESLRFSNHAKKRLESRGISLSSGDIVKLQDAVKKAQDKGAKESLILSEKGAFVVSVENGTVITAVDKGSMKESVFTNIDSTIMI